MKAVEARELADKVNREPDEELSYILDGIERSAKSGRTYFYANISEHNFVKLCDMGYTIAEYPNMTRKGILW